WDGVDCILLAETPKSDDYDPYFFISLDVYYRGRLPDVDDRQRQFSDAGAFESSSVASKDRFLLEDIPVRVEYKDMGRIDEILQRTKDNMWVFRQTGTYMFHRLETGKVLYAESEWIETIRGDLKALPDTFWALLVQSSRATMEHYLSDLMTSVIQENNLYYLISSAGFIKSYLSLLFVANRRFEPSARKLYETVWELKELPENFKGRFESFLRDSPDFPPSRKMELAELMARSILPMC
ncbi:MAG: DUF4037 domain-containing protein, partial [Spirochaetales bacterium]|nr:DUF4037 domain-containing protein [Spirochaetales bacterium]